jgi:hypothetical protein
MADNTSVDLPRAPGDNPAAAAGPDLLRAMVQAFAEALMRTEADSLCGAPYGQPSEQRVNYCNGYRPRRWDTRAGTIDLAIPKLRQGYLQNSWKMAGVQIRQIWNGARLDHNNRPVDQIGGSACVLHDSLHH